MFRSLLFRCRCAPLHFWHRQDHSPRHPSACPLFATSLRPSHQSRFKRPAVGMLKAQHILGVSHISSTLLAKRLLVPLVTVGTVLFPKQIILPFDRGEQWYAIGQLFDGLAVHREG